MELTAHGLFIIHDNYFPDGSLRAAELWSMRSAYGGSLRPYDTAVGYPQFPIAGHCVPYNGSLQSV